MNLVERIVKVKYKDGELIAVTHKPLDEGDKETTFKTRAEGSAGKRCRPGDAGRSAPMSRTGNSPDSAPSCWIDNAMSCKPMDDVDRAAMCEAVNGMYDAAGLSRPKHIVFVPSPLVARVAAGFAPAIWWLHENKAAATDAATDDAPDGWARRLAARISPHHVEFFCRCAETAYRMQNVGNHLSAWGSYLSFFRHVAKLALPVYEKWKHYEAAAVHGSWRFMHPKFCIVSDRPLPWCKDKLVVTGVSWSQSEGTGVEGACIVASAGLETCNAPLNLVTPHLPFDQYSEGAEQPVMPQSGQEALETLRKETMLFLDGSKRAQSTFDFREAA
jgi:hypothetical protein